MTMRKTGGKVPSALDGFRCAGLWAGRMPRHRGLRETWFKGNPLAHRAFAQTTLALPSQVGGPSSGLSGCLSLFYTFTGCQSTNIFR